MRKHALIFLLLLATSVTGQQLPADGELHLWGNNYPGGVNTSLPSNKISDFQAQNITNFFIDESYGLERIYGMKKAVTDKLATSSILLGYFDSVDCLPNWGLYASNSTSGTIASDLSHWYTILSTQVCTWAMNIDNTFWLGNTAGTWYIPDRAGTAGSYPPPDEFDTTFAKGKYALYYCSKIILANCGSGSTSDIRWSSVGISSFPTANYATIGSDKDGAITGIFLINNQPIVLKEFSIYTLQNFDDAYTSNDIILKIASMGSKNWYGIFTYGFNRKTQELFFTSQNGIYSFDGTTLQPVSQELNWTKRQTMRLSSTPNVFSYGWTYYSGKFGVDEKNRYWIPFTTSTIVPGSSRAIENVLIRNQTGQYTYCDLPFYHTTNASSGFYMETFDVAGIDFLTYAVFPDISGNYYCYKFSPTYTDFDGTEIVTNWKSKDFDLGYPVNDKIGKELWIDVRYDPIDTSGIVKYYFNQSSTAWKTITLDLTKSGIGTYKIGLPVGERFKNICFELTGFPNVQGIHFYYTVMPAE